jgi:hypothetical protein
MNDSLEYIEDEKKCKNYIICNSTIPNLDKDICINCDMLYGKWKGGKVSHINKYIPNNYFTI